MMWRKIWISFGIIFLLEVITTIFRGYMSLLIEDVLLSFLIYTTVTWGFIRLKLFSPKQALWIFSISLLVWNIIGVIIDGGLPTVGIPNFAMQFIGILTGYFLSKKSKALGITMVVVFIVFAIWYIKGGNKYWFNYISDGTFTGKIKELLKPDWVLINRNKDTLTAASFRDKIVVLDFWNTGCSVCSREFPHFEALYNSYKANPDMQIYAVNIPLNRDTSGQAFAVIERKNRYTFPVLIGDSAVRAQFGITGFPTIVILKDNEMIFKGRLDLAEKQLGTLVGDK